jgi:hypothetical protein
VHLFGLDPASNDQEDEMSGATGEGGYLPELEAEVEAELSLVESSRPEEITGPTTEWQFDPVDVEREEIALRSLLGAIEAVKGDDHQDADRTADS